MTMMLIHVHWFHNERHRLIRLPALRVGVRDSSYLNYRAWGYISEDERILLSDEGEVYLKMDSRRPNEN